MTKVSIVIPIYNAYKYMSICLDSVVSQTHKNLEIILVDDKSTDKSMVLLKKYKQRYKNIKIISLRKNAGVSHARNMGINAATGDYIFFIDSDDFIGRDAISKMIKVASKYEADVVDTERLFWYQRKSRILTFTEQKRLKEDLVIGNIHNDTRSITYPRYVTGKLYKRSVIKDVRFDENIRCYEDALFNHQIKPNFSKYVYAKGVFYHYLQRPSSLINTINVNHMDYLYVGKEIKVAYESNKYYKLNIKQIVDNLIMEDIMVILSVKIPKMKLSKMRKNKCVKDILELAGELSTKNLKKRYRIVLALFRSNLFISFYFALTSHLNLIDLGFRFLAITHPYKIKDERLMKKVILLYKKIN
ncbi:MAG: glycosyltransferase family 2 protein [Bacilli bacterium]|nr:glycosyltransferase family 2 protein [Bacilli bacterium]MDD3305285.1 glycosyltransferase family 2 protein [Bacilli bacterium]MDD4053575.1 glycosyltransferase family 2 protein [Bacilli bacterium]MDD4411458.1 glycosyltransferase family 2 protein [Bacilli bacterium]